MDISTFNKWLREPRVIDSVTDGELRNLFVDNAAGHNRTEEIDTALAMIRTTLRRFPPNATHLVHPLDNFLIREVKKLWKGIWNRQKKS